ncbi:hypothetical protein LTR41_008728 [Exophiala xenobiotica]|nr:hypothetical protein LTR41_008728 [Exophiala xenobiotica]
MARSLNGRDQSSDDPISSFAAPGTSHFDSNAFSFPIDTQLAMNPNYGMSSYPRDLGDPTTSINHPVTDHLGGITAASNGSVSGAGADVSMAPPQNPNQASFIPTRESVDESSEHTGDKRKRSKTSRACDECRRKKVRCDAPVEADGTPKTCTNCQKADVLCEFERKPMKRGPSKGYIKELAERVQQVEHVQKQALRQSLDGSSNLAGYAEAFSPDESTPRRHFSFNDPRNPFAPVEFQRDRIPSTGAWGNIAPGLRPRDVGSLAIAPDQSMPGPPSNQMNHDGLRVSESVKPFWAELESPPPPKRARLDDPYAKLQPFNMNQAHLSKYYDHVHPLFALLPDAETVSRIVHQASPGLQHSFAVAIVLMGNSENGSVTNGNHADTTSQFSASPLRHELPTTAFEDFEELASHVVSVAQQGGPDTISGCLLCVWTLVLLAAACDSDIRHVQGSSTTKTDLINSSLRMTDQLRATAPTAFVDSMDQSQFDQIVQQSFNCACLLSKLHALSVGSGLQELSVADRQSKDTMVGYADTTKIPPEAGFLTHSSNIVGMVSCLLPLDPYSPIGSQVKRTLAFSLFEDTLKRYPPLTLDSPIVQQTQLFLDLLMSRFPDNEFSPMLVQMKTAQLAEFLTSHSTTVTPFNPLDMHCWSIVTITFCEFVIHARSEVYTNPASENLSRLKVALQNRSEAFHKTYGYSWFWSETKAAADEYRMSHWADCLINMIDNVEVSSTSLPEGAGDNAAVLPNLSLLLAQGWFRVLYHYRWKD